MRKPVLPLARSDEEALEAFRLLVAEGILEVRGERIEVDFGNYVHVMRYADRVSQIPWIAPTLLEPDRIIRLLPEPSASRPRQIENYARTMHCSEDDWEGTLFLVGVERTPFGLRLRTWFAPIDQEGYLERLEGETIWTPKQRP